MAADPAIDFILGAVNALGCTSTMLVQTLAVVCAESGFDVVRQYIRRLGRRGVVQCLGTSYLGIPSTPSTRSALAPGARFEEALRQIEEVPFTHGALDITNAAPDYRATLWLLDACAAGATVTEDAWSLCLPAPDRTCLAGATDVGVPSSDRASPPGEPPVALGFESAGGDVVGIVAGAGWLRPLNATARDLITSTGGITRLGKKLDLFIGMEGRAEEVACARLLVGHHSLSGAGVIHAWDDDAIRMPVVECAVMNRIHAARSRRVALWQAIQTIGAFRSASMQRGVLGLEPA
jgi:hypothetical protein